MHDEEWRGRRTGAYRSVCEDRAAPTMTKSGAEFARPPNFTIPPCASSIRPRIEPMVAQFWIKRSSTRNWIGGLHHTKREGRL